jgi:uncharacterized protein
MRFLLSDLQHDPIEFDQAFAASDITYTDDVVPTGPLSVQGRADLVEEHHGPHQIIEDIRVRAHYSGQFELPCARCIEPVSRTLEGDFDLLYRPAGLPTTRDEESITTAETEIGYYQGDGLELEDVLREQVLLSLPPRVLCSPDCKGLCPHCGQDLNTAQCDCQAAPADPRWNALGDLRNRIKN